jgi:hypothetical protein
MKRLAAVLATAGALATAGPASACLTGEPAPGSCGLGRPAVQAAIQDPASPGATEVARMKPAERACTGAPAR